MDDSNLNNKPALKQFKATPARAPLNTNKGMLATIKHRCFNNIANSLLTICVAVVLYYFIRHVLDWAVFNAVFTADNRRQCLAISPDGACWAGVLSWFNGLIYGRFPIDEQWRVNVGVLLALVWLLPLFSKRIAMRNYILLSLIALYPFIAGYLFLGGQFGVQLGLFHGAMTCVALAFLTIIYANWLLSALGHKGLNELFVPLFSRLFKHRIQLLSCLAVWLPLALVFAVAISFVSLEPVDIDRWGGVFLTLIIAGFAISMAIPVGIVLALGRRSQMPVVHWISLSVIELVRSVPLITVLFMAVTLLPIFLPADMEFNKLTQVLVAVCIFAGAYMAENIRGGLQAIPQGQFEAAATLGLGYMHTMMLVILPQALKMMIPNIMTSFISLLKDTTLVSIIGLFDIMLMARNIANDKDWIGLHTEPLVMISVLFFILCYSMSQYSLNLEKRLKVDH